MDAKTADSRRQSASQTGANPTMWARLAAQLVGFAERSGVLRERLLAHCGLRDQDFADPDARIPLEAVYQLVEVAVDATGDEHFGLHFAELLEVKDLDAVGFLILTSATLGEAFERSVKYQNVFSDGERYACHRCDARLHLSYTPYGRPRPAHRQMAEMAFYDLAINGARLVGTELTALAVRFRHARPNDPSIHEQYWGTAVEFGAPINELVFSDAIWDIPMPEANAAMCQFFERYAQTLLNRVPVANQLRDRVRAFIEGHLHDGPPGIDTVAAHLRMSTRTLQRRLRSEGCSVHDLVDEVRRERAVIFLDTAMAITEIAYLLGYSEASAFHRAFKRWTGATPERFRRQP